jgi:hypothetical protein
LADILVLGAGAAGLYCAREAALRGRSVAVVDHSPEPGKKLLLSGGGRCNFTNLNAAPDAYLSRNPAFCASALSRHGPAEFIALMDSSGVPWHEEGGGKLFCDKGAGAVRDMLVAGCREAGVRLELGRKPGRVRREGGLFAADEGLSAPRLVVATGGLAAARTGATGVGLEIARSFGLKIVEPEPALVGLRWAGPDAERWSGLSGIALDGVAVSCGGRAFREAVLLTHTGLSGPGILQASLHWKPGEAVTIDLLPGLDPLPWFKSVRQERGGVRPREFLEARLPARFAERFSAAFLPDTPLARLSDREIADITSLMHGWKVEPAGSEGFERAEVMRGGVDTTELSSKTMESRKVPGLYFIGEVVDVTGALGGFNLQWAWSSAAACAEAV